MAKDLIPIKQGIVSTPVDGLYFVKRAWNALPRPLTYVAGRGFLGGATYVLVDTALAQFGAKGSYSAVSLLSKAATHFAFVPNPAELSPEVLTALDPLADTIWGYFTFKATYMIVTNIVYGGELRKLGMRSIDTPADVDPPKGITHIIEGSARTTDMDRRLIGKPGSKYTL